MKSKSSKTKLTSTKPTASKDAAKKPMAKKPVTQKAATTKIVNNKTMTKKAEVKKPITNTEHNYDTKSREYCAPSGDFMFDMLRPRCISDLVITVLNIIIFGSIISLAFSYGGDIIGVVVIGAVVTVYSVMRGHKVDKDHESSCCWKTFGISAVIGGLSTWVCMEIGNYLAGEAGYVIGIIVGIVIALRLTSISVQKVCQ